MITKNAQFVFALLAASSRIERRLDRAVSNVKGVSFTEYHLLKQLSGFHNGAATRVDLAAAVHLTPSAVTRALKPLEKLGYVKSEKSDRDARQSLATLTAAGEELLNDANSLVTDEIATLSIPGSVRSELIGVLDRLGPR